MSGFPILGLAAVMALGADNSPVARSEYVITNRGYDHPPVSIGWSHSRKGPGCAKDPGGVQRAARRKASKVARKSRQRNRK